MTLFEVIAHFFNYKYKEVTDLDKTKNSFMINRFCSIYYPLHAAYLSLLKINSKNLVNFWHYTLSNKYKQIPNWFFSKTDKKKAVKKPDDIDEKLIIQYCKFYKCSLKDFEACLELFPKETKKEMKEFDKFVNFKKADAK